MEVLNHLEKGVCVECCYHGGRSKHPAAKVVFSLQYLLYVPLDRNGKQTVQIPLLLFLHGASTRGDSLASLHETALPALIKSKEVLPECLVVAPLCPEKTEWKSTAMCAAVIELLDYLQEDPMVDERRTYLTGVSMGGLGSYILSARYPNRFQAVAPICGGGHPVFAPLLASVPFWFWHSADDNVIGVEETDNLVRAMPHAKYTRYDISPDSAAKSWMVGHNCWDRTYKGNDIWAWFTAQKSKL